MKWLDLTLPTAAENLACDEALVDWCELSNEPVLRFWESPSPFVVVGFANRVSEEVNVPACVADGIPILRRCSGGGTVLQGPGCLNYTLGLPIEETGPTASVPETNRFVMNRQCDAARKAIAAHGIEASSVNVRGCTDLALGDRKFSGNAQRRKRRALLFHGTFLLQFDLPAISKYLAQPSKQPEYRSTRGHLDFLMNFPANAADVISAIRGKWKAEEQWDLPESVKMGLSSLVSSRYSQEDWNRKF
jgi:lipoate-protein ligase A